MTQDAVLYEVDEGVATLTLNRPDRLNAWNGAMATRFHDLIDEATADAEVRAIVLTGAGRGFCAGADMDDLQDIGEAGGLQPSSGRDTAPARTMDVPKPIIAAVNGACAGLGMAYALMCDVRFAAAGAKFTTAFSRRGLIAEHGLSWLLPRIAGQGAAMDLLLSARVFLAEEAAELGLVNRVVEPEQLMEEATAYARDLAVNASPSSMKIIKQQLRSHHALAFAPAMSESNRLMVESLARPDFKEGVASFVERRPPRFEGITG